MKAKNLRAALEHVPDEALVYLEFYNIEESANEEQIVSKVSFIMEDVQPPPEKGDKVLKPKVVIS